VAGPLEDGGAFSSFEIEEARPGRTGLPLIAGRPGGDPPRRPKALMNRRSASSGAVSASIRLALQSDVYDTVAAAFKSRAHDRGFGYLHREDIEERPFLSTRDFRRFPVNFSHRRPTSPRD